MGSEPLDHIEKLSYIPEEGQYCDIVMKGGITSGVVYPHGVCQLASRYRFKNIGGTSAGAIAAALTAAAEVGRQRDLDSGNLGKGINSFERLARLPSELGQEIDTPRGRRSRLVSLFQNQAGTQAAYELLLAALSPGNKLFNLLKAAITQAPWSALLGFVGGVVLIEVLAGARNPLLGPMVAFLVGIAGAVVGVVVKVAIELVRSLPRNAYGICAGTETTPAYPPALSTWLADLLDQLAGKKPGEILTFGDLAQPGVTLKFITSCVSQGKPYALPFEPEVAGRFYFNPDELRHHLPVRVIEHMKQHARRESNTLNALRDSGRLKELGLEKLLPLPNWEDMPVMVAVRMSLSFPILLSAVPLYSVDYTRKDPRDRVPSKCWFSDGGLCSNFPIHFFDSPFPSQPTFGFNLRPFPRDFPRQEDQSKNVSSPQTSSQGREATWRYFERSKGRLGAFLGALFDLTQNWSDNTLLEMPGQRERVAHVYLEGSEGGLNLVMGQKSIDDLALRGRYAAKLLMDKFDTTRGNAASRGLVASEDYSVNPESFESEESDTKERGLSKPSLTWDDHRYIRLRSSMGAMGRYFVSLDRKIQQHGPQMLELLEEKLQGRLSQAERQQLKDQLTRLAELARSWREMQDLLEKGEPSPKPELKSRPKL